MNTSTLSTLTSAAKASGYEDAVDLLLHAPSKYIDFTSTLDISRSIPVGERVVIEVEVQQPLKKVEGKQLLVTRFSERIRTPTHMMTAGNHNRSINLYFGDRVAKTGFTQLRRANRFFVAGKLELQGGDFFIYNPELAPKEWHGKIMPVYVNLRGQVGGRRKTVLDKHEIRKGIVSLLDSPEYLDKLTTRINASLGDKPLPEGFIKRLVKCLHHPLSIEQIKTVQQWVDEIGIRTLLASERVERVANPESAIPVDNHQLEELIGRIPFTLSDSQREAINESVADLRSQLPMRRIISGDVGSGKSVVQYVCAAATHLAGRSAAIMTPNGLLATQLYNEFKANYPDIPAVYLGGGGSRKIDLSTNPVLIGTTAVLHFVTKHDLQLDFISIDEQQKAGLEQKAGVISPKTNIAECTATPIPLSLALMLFSDTAISRIYPHVAKDIRSFIVGPDQRKKMFNLLMRRIKNGGKICVIYAKIENDADDSDSDSSRRNRKSLEEAYEQWSALLPGKVAVLHGRLKPEEKAAEMERINNNEVSVVLATTVLEIGITIKELYGMVVYSPHFMGSSSLHQLRGRLVRAGEGTGLFFMYCDTPIPRPSMARLESVRDINDGFDLAQRDLELRGFGDFLGGGSRQHGKTYGLFKNRDIDPKHLEPYLLSLSRTGSFGEALERELPDLNF